MTSTYNIKPTPTGLEALIPRVGGDSGALARWPEGGGERSEVGPRGRSKAKRACLLKPNHKERSDGLSLGPLIEVQGSQTLEYLVPPKSRECNDRTYLSSSRYASGRCGRSPT
jgi:hypothetical protein